MKLQEFPNIYFYRNPLGINCNVYAFKREDGLIDLIDTGYYYLRPILSRVLKGMKKDGLDFRAVQTIYHTHGHFDHCQADKWFIKHSMNEGVKVYCPELDAWRLLKDNGINQLAYFKNHVAEHLPGDMDELMGKSGFGSIVFQFRFFMSRLMHIPVLKDEWIATYKDGASLEIGGHDVKVITTGGHSDGHSFFHFPDLDLLVVGDHDAVNETTCDYRKIIKASAIIRDIAPNAIFIGHNATVIGRDRIKRKMEIWFKKFNQYLNLFSKVAEKYNGVMSLKWFLDKMLGFTGKITWIRYWAFQTLFVITKIAVAEELGYLKYDRVLEDLVMVVDAGKIKDFQDHFEENVERIKNS